MLAWGSRWRQRLVKAPQSERASQRNVGIESYKKLRRFETLLYEQENLTQSVKNHWSAEFNQINAVWTERNTGFTESWEKKVKKNTLKDLHSDLFIYLFW